MHRLFCSARKWIHTNTKNWNPQTDFVHNFMMYECDVRVLWDNVEAVLVVGTRARKRLTKVWSPTVGLHSFVSRFRGRFWDAKKIPRWSLDFWARRKSYWGENIFWCKHSIVTSIKPMLETSFILTFFIWACATYLFLVCIARRS
jgi:hypothetical protein